MTYIPGTGSRKISDEAKTHPKSDSQTQTFSVINVHQLKNPVSKDVYPDDQLWYNQLKYWLIFGTLGSAIFAILAIINWRFLFLLPLGPYMAYLSWHLKRWVRKHSKNLDAFSQRF